jgi:predicted unusual protein kinase regulating ubiquinone biosynthesis (AarF/ABC1/UbiB family)
VLPTDGANLYSPTGVSEASQQARPLVYDALLDRWVATFRNDFALAAESSLSSIATSPQRTLRFELAFEAGSVFGRVSDRWTGFYDERTPGGVLDASTVLFEGDISGERIAETLGELKGAAMKIGQMASIGSDILPKELSDALTKLQKEAPPMPYEVIAEQIERELGSPPELLFNAFDETPFASASIGQVHRATTDDGRDVVVKVQYPGVRSSIDSDIANVAALLRLHALGCPLDPSDPSASEGARPVVLDPMYTGGSDE